MSNYTIGLSGLNTNSSAIDVISNNIANASTVGYKAGEYVFADQFYKAINPLDPARAGQGAARQNIRRLWNMGTIQETQNTLDMAITGAMGMFRLTDGTDPDTVYYTRNGMFAVSKETDPNFPKRSYIVNQNGMFLTGYASQNGKDLDDQWTSRLSMPPTELEPVTTTQSTIAVNLDSRTNVYLDTGDVPFDPNTPSTYNNRVSQTVYSAEDSGAGHTVSLYYRRIDDKDMTVTFDGANFYYPASDIAKNPQGSSQMNVVLTGDTSRGIALVSAPNRTSNVNGAMTTSTVLNVKNAGNIEKYARLMVNGVDAATAVASKPTSVGGTAATNTQQFDQIEISGTFAAGEQVSITVGGVAVTYTVKPGDIVTSGATSGTFANIARGLADAYEASTNAVHTPITATASGAKVLLSANVTGAAFTAAAAWAEAPSPSKSQTTTTPAASGTAQVDTISLGGTYVAGDVITFTLGANDRSYTITAANVAGGGASTDDYGRIAASIVSAINADTNFSGSLTASVSGSSVLLTEVGTAGAGFAVTSSLTPAMRSTSGGVATRSSLYVDDGGTGVNQQVTIAGNYAEDDLLTITVNGVDVNYTVTATDVAGGGNTAADFARIAAGFKAAYDASTNLAHTPVAMTQDGAVLTLAANVQTVPFTLDSDVTGDSSVTIDAAISVSDGDKVEFFNPAAVIASATSAAVGSRNITVAPSAAVEPGQYVFKVVNGVVTRLVDSAGAPIRVSANNGTALQLSAVPSVDLSSATLVFYNPVSYQLTLQDGSKVSMSGDLNSKNVGQQFTAVTSQYEVYASLDEKFYNAGDNKFYSDIPFEQPVGNGVYKPVAEMQFWGGKNIDALVTNEISGKPTFESQVVLTGKVTTNGNNALSTDPDLIFNLDLTGTKNFATPFGVDQSTQDGRSVALLNSVSIDDEGKIVGTYGDGRSFIAGQLVLVNFAATDGLVPSGENVFTSSYMSGDEVDASVIVGRPGDKGLGGIRAGAVEGSNVDLANELVKLLIQQRMYSANSQSIRAFDDTLTTTIRMAGG